MRRNQFLSVLFVILTAASSALAADFSGKWKASFDTEIGVQNYTYDFKVAGDKLTGSAESNLGKATITDGTVTGDTVSFVENLDMQGNAVRIEYTGKLTGDEIKFTRKVADFATEELVAKRVKE